MIDRISILKVSISVTDVDRDRKTEEVERTNAFKELVDGSTGDTNKLCMLFFCPVICIINML